MSDIPWIVIDLQEGRYWGDCPLCDLERRLDHAVGWYCGPVKENPGERVPGWKCEAIAGGKAVCKACHDKFYGLPTEHIATKHKDEDGSSAAAPAPTR